MYTKHMNSLVEAFFKQYIFQTVLYRVQRCLKLTKLDDFPKTFKLTIGYLTTRMLR